MQVKPLTSMLGALMSGSASAVKGVTPAIIAAGEEAMKAVYSKTFRLIYLVSIAFGGNTQPFFICLCNSRTDLFVIGLAIIATLFIRSVDNALTKYMTCLLVPTGSVLLIKSPRQTTVKLENSAPKVGRPKTNANTKEPGTELDEIQESC